MKTTAQAHRFRQHVAAYLGNGETVYMTVEDAVKFSTAVLACANDIRDAPSYSQSKFNTFEITLSNNGSRYE